MSSRPGLNPKWNKYHLFEFSNAGSIDITVYDKGILFSDREIGKCKIQLSDISQGHQIEWWAILNSSNTSVGMILINFELPNDDSTLMTSHSPHDSLGMRDDFYLNLDSDIAKESMQNPWENYRREKSRNKSNISEENAEKLKNELILENSRLRDIEANIKLLFEKARKDSMKIKKDKAEIKRLRENLKRREQSLQVEENAIIQEKNRLIKEKEEVLATKAQLNHDIAKLKQETHKLSLEKRDIESFSKEIGSISKKIAKEKILLKKASLTTKQPQNLLCDESMKAVSELNELEFK